MTSAISPNPLCPPGVYIADPEAHQMPDGAWYVYGSRDETRHQYCSRHYDMLWSADGSRWHLEANTFTTEGVNGAGAHRLYAPDAVHRDGRYYLYYCLSNSTEGVATADHPLGPFGDASPLVGLDQIDPTVFIDDDGQGYLYWGQFSAKAAKLAPDMRSIEAGSLVDGVITEAEHFFHEGCSIRKRQGIYYLCYAHIGRRDRPTCIGYATATSPLGPFTYRGIIIDNFGCDPETWNNHGCISEFNGNWYVFYHRTTNACRSLRKACAERIAFDEAGLIAEVPMTSSGIGDPLPATTRIDGGQACELKGQVRCSDSAGGFSDLVEIRNGDAACYRWIAFSEDIARVTVCVAGGGFGGTIEVHLDNLDGPLVGTVTVACRWPGDWAIHSADLTQVTGIHAVWLVFRGAGEAQFDLRWMRFTP